MSRRPHCPLRTDRENHVLLGTTGKRQDDWSLTPWTSDEISLSSVHLHLLICKQRVGVVILTIRDTYLWMRRYVSHWLTYSPPCSIREHKNRRRSSWLSNWLWPCWCELEHSHEINGEYWFGHANATREKSHRAHEFANFQYLEWGPLDCDHVGIRDQVCSCDLEDDFSECRIMS